jgi:UDP-N-acetylglucosamine--N-acetylmuramyl-(pentapeptide) pyrophosphoryl-undecaprenol N-acetylglucosamine transferase
LSDTPPLFIFAGGGTGGHLYPALAVAQELTALLPGCKIVFACSNRDIDRRVLGNTHYAVVPQPVRPLPTRLGDVAGFLSALVTSRRLAKSMIADLKPSAVLGLGGFAAAPLVRAAADAGVPAGMLNPDAVPGKANKYLARHVGVIFTQFAGTAGCFGRAGGKVRQVGCPVRPSLLGASRQEAQKQLGLRDDRRTLVVLGGSLGAASINDAIVAMLEDFAALAERWQVLHVTGPQKDRRVDDAAATAANYRAMEYCHQMDLAYATADLAVCRGGAVTVAELSATGTPAIILPYPYHADNQQRLNAAALAAAGAAVVIDDAKDGPANAQALRGTLLPLMREPARLDSMRAAALAQGKPHAAREVAQWLADSAGR